MIFLASRTSASIWSVVTSADWAPRWYAHCWAEVPKAEKEAIGCSGWVVEVGDGVELVFCCVSLGTNEFESSISVFFLIDDDGGEDFSADERRNFSFQDILHRLNVENYRQM